MSRLYKGVVGFILTVLVSALLAVISVGTAPAAAAPGDPIIPTTHPCVVELVFDNPNVSLKAPICSDVSGNDLDEFLSPDYKDENDMQVLYTNSDYDNYFRDRPNSTFGQSEVMVYSQYYDPAKQYYVDGDSWRLRFNTAVTSQPAQHDYWVEVGSCIGAIDKRYVTAYFRNNSPDRYMGWVFPEATAIGDGVRDTKPALRVLPGATAAIPLVTFNDTEPGLSAGKTFTVTFRLEERNSLFNSRPGQYVGAELKVVVPACTIIPPPTTAPTKPVARTVVLRKGAVFSRVRTVLGTPKSNKAYRYVVARDPKYGRTTRSVHVTKHKWVTLYKVRRGTVVRVWVNGRLLHARRF